MLDVINEDYILTARAKGLKGHTVVIRHTLRNAALPVVTIVGLMFGTLMAGAVITETIFVWPGVGLLTIQAIQNRDFPLVQAAVLIVSITFVFVNLGVDLLYAYIDPRIKYG
jgi:peptide/nickel transport system permease protein